MQAEYLPRAHLQRAASAPAGTRGTSLDAMEKKDLLAPKPIYLPDDPAHHAQDILAVETAIVHPESPLVWARRTEVALEHAEKAQENARQEAGASSVRARSTSGAGRCLLTPRQRPWRSFFSGGGRAGRPRDGTCTEPAAESYVTLQGLG